MTVLADTAIRGHDLDEAKALKPARGRGSDEERQSDIDLAVPRAKFAMMAAQIARDPEAASQVM